MGYLTVSLPQFLDSPAQHSFELLAILVPASAILLLLLLVAVALTVVICRRRIEKLRKRHSDVRQGVVRLCPPVGNIYHEVDDVYLVLRRPIMPTPSQGGGRHETRKPAMLRVNMEEDKMHKKHLIR